MNKTLSTRQINSNTHTNMQLHLELQVVYVSIYHWNLANYKFTCKISFKKNMGMPGYRLYNIGTLYYRMCMILLYTNAK